MAMYEAKERGKDGVVVFDPGADRRAQAKAGLSWAERIRSALERDHLFLEAQPIVALDAPDSELPLRAAGADALRRRRDRAAGRVPAGGRAVRPDARHRPLGAGTRRAPARRARPRRPRRRAPVGEPVAALAGHGHARGAARRARGPPRRPAPPDRGDHRDGRDRRPGPRAGVRRRAERDGRAAGAGRLRRRLRLLPAPHPAALRRDQDRRRVREEPGRRPDAPGAGAVAGGAGARPRART